MVLKDKYINYENAKIILNLDSLEERRQILCLKFAKNGIKNNNLNDLFPENDRKSTTRRREKIQQQQNNRKKHNNKPQNHKPTNEQNNKTQ